MTIRFDVQTALRFANQGDLETWVHLYLTTGSWANHVLSRGLRLQQRWWRGPIELPLTYLNRCCGPEPDMEYRTDPAAWEQRIAALAASFSDRQSIPPLIVQYQATSLSIRDGNHRYAAMQRKGRTTAWAIVWYDSRNDFERDATLLHLPNH
jgi:ParB-like nuclease domain